MIRTVLIVVGLVTVSAAAFAQPQASAQDTFDRAPAAAPRQMEEAATVIKWKPDGTYDTLRHERANERRLRPPVTPGTTVRVGVLGAGAWARAAHPPG